MKQKSFLGESRKTITVQRIQDTPLEIEAEVFGQFGIHASLEGKGWTITYIPSGAALMAQMVEYDVAIALAQRLSALDFDTLWRKECESEAFYARANELMRAFFEEYRVPVYRFHGRVCEEGEQ